MPTGWQWLHHYSLQRTWSISGWVEQEGQDQSAKLKLQLRTSALSLSLLVMQSIHYNIQ